MTKITAQVDYSGGVGLFPSKADLASMEASKKEDQVGFYVHRRGFLEGVKWLRNEILKECEQYKMPDPDLAEVLCHIEDLIK